MNNLIEIPLDGTVWKFCNIHGRIDVHIMLEGILMVESQGEMKPSWLTVSMLRSNPDLYIEIPPQPADAKIAELEALIMDLRAKLLASEKSKVTDEVRIEEAKSWLKTDITELLRLRAENSALREEICETHRFAAKAWYTAFNSLHSLHSSILKRTP